MAEMKLVSRAMTSTQQKLNLTPEEFASLQKQPLDKVLRAMELNIIPSFGAKDGKWMIRSLDVAHWPSTNQFNAWSRMLKEGQPQEVRGLGPQYLTFEEHGQMHYHPCLPGQKMGAEVFAELARRGELVAATCPRDLVPKILKSDVREFVARDKGLRLHAVGRELFAQARVVEAEEKKKEKTMQQQLTAANAETQNRWRRTTGRVLLNPETGLEDPSYEG